MARIAIHPLLSRMAVATLMVSAMMTSTTSFADPLGFAGPFFVPGAVVEEDLAEIGDRGRRARWIPISLHLRRQIVDYSTREAPGTIIIDTPRTYLYLVLGGGRAIRYGIGVGREGFTWSGVRTIERKTEWPDWIPPAEMLERQPYLPRFMAGGPGNPLGARAMYLSGTLYRIHGTNDPSTIGKRVSSGCIRLMNEDVVDLFAHVNTGTKVVVLPMHSARTPALTGEGRSILNTARNALANASRAHGLY